MSRRHRSARPRYGRVLLAAAAVVVTVLAVLGGVGVVPTAPSAAEGERSTAVSALSPTASSPSADPSSDPPSGALEAAASVPSIADPGASVSSEEVAESVAEPAALPVGSGAGRRIVFSEAEQRVWLVRRNGSVRRTYLVSGSLEDNLDPGTYAVFSRSRYAVGLDDSGVMEFFVRFAQGERAAIGFHTIPTKLGAPLQTRAQLGTPQSHGCIRQAKADAISLWKFAPEGASVVVV